MAIDLGDGDVQVAPPELPSIVAAPPTATEVHVVPVAGTRGPPGVPGTSDGATIQSLIDATVGDHIVAPEPHPAYDVDMPNLVLLFENRLV